MIRALLYQFGVLLVVAESDNTPLANHDFASSEANNSLFMVILVHTSFLTIGKYSVTQYIKKTRRFPVKRMARGGR